MKEEREHLIKSSVARSARRNPERDASRFGKETRRNYRGPGRIQLEYIRIASISPGTRFRGDYRVAFVAIANRTNVRFLWWKPLRVRLDPNEINLG